MDVKKAFNRVQREMLEWSMGKKRIAEVLVRSIINQYEGTKTAVTVDSNLSEEVKVGMHQGSVLSSFHKAVVLDEVTELMSSRISSKNGKSILRARV